MCRNSSAFPVLVIALFTISAVPASGQSDFWTPVPSFTAGNVQSLLTLPNNTLLAGLYNPGTAQRYGILRSTDAGSTWNASNAGLLDSAVVTGFTRAPDGSVLSSASGMGFGARSSVYRSTDGGINWSPLWQSPFGSQVQSVLSPAESVLIAGTSQSGVYRSTNDGASWSQTFPGTSPNAFVYALVMTPLGTVLASSPALGILRSTDSGATWTNLQDSLSQEAILSLAVTSAGVLFAGTTQSGVYRSLDDGITWSSLPASPHSTNIWALTVTSAQEVFAGTSQGVFRSLNGGDEWSDVSSGLPPTNNHVWCLAKDATNHLLAGHIAGGVYRSQGTVTAAPFVDHEAPEGYTLIRNYPNPFNPSTTIEYSLPRSTRVRVSIFSLSGELVRILKDEKASAGTHRIQWNGRDMNDNGVSSGVYIVRLDAEGTLRTNKLVLVR